MQRTLIAIVMSSAWGGPPVKSAKPKSVQSREVRTVTEDAGVQASRLQGTLASVNAAGKGVDCPKEQATKLPATALEDASYEPKYTEVLMANGRAEKISVVPKSMLKKIYDTMQTRDYDRKSGGTDPSINWNNECLCRERAHFLGDKLARKLNLETGKLLVSVRFGPMAQPIVATLPNQRRATWKRHAANFIMVEERPGEKPVMYALDVGLFPNAPVPVEQWRKKLENVGDDGWADFFMSKGRVAVTNRFAYSSGDQASYIDKYPSVGSGDSRGLDQVNTRLYGVNQTGSCLGRM